MYNWILLLSYMLAGESHIAPIQSYQSYMECGLAAPEMVGTVEAMPGHTDVEAHCLELVIKVRD